MISITAANTSKHPGDEQLLYIFHPVGDLRLSEKL